MAVSVLLRPLDYQQRTFRFRPELGRETVLFMSAMGRLFEGTYDRDEAEPVIINAIEQPDTAVCPAFGPIASRTQPNS